ncbi:DUF1749-domain-containing protein [Ascodesmis nigricans]|uniref:DUF1749-domain-containing protein n=1 Tax=Ascodesmis nigricans TaxID=341454 RepID=A0A4S2MXJ2_9PEZI|nr:DUF1749-domain-containing protein [Ascodesmis nigricans]
MSSQPGTIHHYSTSNPKLIAFEHTLSASNDAPPNYLLFIGGMGDGLNSVPIVSHLSPHIPSTWRLIEVLTTSSYIGWGTGSLKRDVEEISLAVGYFRAQATPDVKIVVMGHSTGSQDVLQYTLTMANEGEMVEKLDGAILQAPVSDRESIAQSTDRTTYLTSLTFADSFRASGQGEDVMPLSLRPGFEDTPVSAERWYSITAPLHPVTKQPQGADDFFSSDILPETLNTTFGHIPTDLSLLVLYSGSDQHVPGRVDKEALVARWKDACKAKWSSKGGIVKGADHAMKDVTADVIADFVSRVTGFLGDVSGGGEAATTEESGAQKEPKEPGPKISIKEAAERAPGTVLEETPSHQETASPSPSPTPAPSATGPTIIETPSSPPPAASSSETNEESANALKPTEIEEAAIRPSEVEETEMETSVPPQESEESMPEGAKVDPVVKKALETEVKEVREGKGVEEEVALAEKENSEK